MLTIFTDAFLHRLLPFQQEITLNAMRHLNLAAYTESVWVAGAGALCASTVLYVVGIWLRRMPAKVSTEGQQARIQRMQRTAREWLPWLLILSPSPVGGMLMLAAGFFAIRPILAGCAVLAAELLWRGLPLL